VSAFTEPLAQVREALNKPWCPNLGSCPPEMHSGCSYCAAHEDALADLDRVERLATDMETALERIEEEARQGKIKSEMVSIHEEWPVHDTIHRFSVIRQIARAALTGEETE
jgi:hypothetical protein